HQITGSSVGVLTDYQVRFKVHYGSGVDSGEDIYLNSHCRMDFGDVRFTGSDGSALLDYWIEDVSGAMAIFWVKIPNIPESPDNTDIYVYYGNPGATATSNGFQTFIRFDNGTSGNFDEDVRGTASLSHSGGLYMFTEDSVDDAFAAGMNFTNWGLRAFIKGLSEISGPGTIVHYGFIDQNNVSNVCGDATHSSGETRFGVNRMDPVYPQGILTGYTDTGDNSFRWDGSAWSSSGGWFDTSGPLDIELRASSTTLYLDVLSGGVSVYANPATVPISSVKGFSLGKVLAFTESYTTHYVASGSVDAFYVGKYCDPEPGHGDWGAEQGPPGYSNIDHSFPSVGGSCTFSVYWQDPDGLDACIFSTNVSGSWQNETVSVSGTGSWANVTKTLPSSESVVVGYRWYCNDTNGVWSDTGVHCLTIPTWFSGWSYRKPHRILGSSVGVLTDYQVRFKVHYGSGVDSGEDIYLNSHCREDFGDIRFTTEDGETLLDYWMEDNGSPGQPNKYFADNGAEVSFSPVNYPNAIYYNNKTYIAYSGLYKTYITYFNHTSNCWGEIVEIADGVDLGHGYPAIIITDEGKIIIAYDCHEDARIRISSNPEDISSWEPPQQVFTYATYHRFVKDSYGNIYYFVMHGDAADSSKFCYKVSSDGGENWNSTNVIVDFQGSGIVYVGNVEYDIDNNRSHFGWCMYQNNKRVNTYHAYLDMSTGTMSSIDETNLGITISESEANAYCTVLDTGLYEAQIPLVHLDSNGYPYFIITYGISGDFNYVFIRWTGSSWSTPQTITSTNSRTNVAEFIVHSSSNIEAYMANRSCPCGRGGDIEKWIWDGTNWSIDSVIMTEKESGRPLTVPMCVKDGHSSLKVLFSQHSIDQPIPGYQTATGDMKIYAYGDDGFVVGEENTIGKEVEFWVKIPDISEGPDNTDIYVYYGNPDATTISNGFNTFIRFDNGTSGNFDEDVRGTASLSHSGGLYMFTEDSVDDAFAAGMNFTNWG
ncbi:MAG: DUF2341 domain-containing protein, partial [Candidatus Thermoplasmatota archaeon]|nr:DUF2341 domain-containing protein [Candidatus Thermoplasmatota archaeon]